MANINRGGTYKPHTPQNDTIYISHTCIYTYILDRKEMEWNKGKHTQQNNTTNRLTKLLQKSSQQ